MAYAPQPLPFSGAPEGISEKTLTTHHNKLYVGYVNKKNEIDEKLASLEQGGDVSGANQSYSELRALKDGETFAVNGVYLHEWYFEVLHGDGVLAGSLADALTKKHRSIENFLHYFAACAVAARGWVVLAYDTHVQELKVYCGDAHNQGGVWGAVPLIVLDVYEHAYFMDYGSDRAAYIQAFLKQLNWTAAEKKYAATVQQS